MKTRATFIIFLFLLCSTARSQDSRKTFFKEITVITENDNYNLTQQDRYYTNGFFLKFNWIQKRQAQKTGTIKTINRAEAGHMIYNSFSNRRSAAEVLQKLDRPYAGWLYASFGRTKVYPNHDVLLYDATVGIMGPSARGQQIQTGYHRFMQLYKIYGWEYQLKDEPGINLSASYYRSIVAREPGSNITLHAVGKATLGNTFTNAAAGLLFKIGKLENENNTAYWSANMGMTHEEKNHKTEVVVFTEPLLLFQAYNATVQGGLFRQDKGYYTTSLDRLQLLVRSGLVVSGRRAALHITVTYKSREAKTMIDKSEVYPAFGFTYRFH